MQIAMVGAGYVGLVTGACLAELGHVVTCYDRDQGKIAALLSGVLPMYEPGLAEIVWRNRQHQHLDFTVNLQQAVGGAECVFIAVGTPADSTGAADLGDFWQVANDLLQVFDLQTPPTLVVKSTVPPGTSEQLRQHVHRAVVSRGGHSVEVVHNPEFLKEGRAVEDFRRPDRIVVGCCSKRGEDFMRRLYGPFLRNGHPLLCMDLASAELTKYASNAFLAARISLINELASLCGPLGADIENVRLGVGADSRLGRAFLYAGIGYGGSCFPKDIQALRHVARAQHIPTAMLDAIHTVNEQQKGLLLRMLLRLYPKLEGMHFTVWGLAFKPHTDDVRDAPALRIIAALLQVGATVCAYDPIAQRRAHDALPAHASLTFADDHYSAVDGADALLLCTEWDLFRTPDWSKVRRRMRQPVVLDGRNLYDLDAMEQAGFRYFGVGRGLKL